MLYIRSSHPPDSRPSEQDTTTATVNFPYIYHLSDTIRRILASQLPAILHTAAAIGQTEGLQPLQQQANEVYRIPSGSRLNVYISKTGRTPEDPLKEHRRALKSGNTAQSAVSELAVDQVYESIWKEAEVVNSHSYLSSNLHWKLGTSIQSTRR